METDTKVSIGKAMLMVEENINGLINLNIKANFLKALELEKEKLYN